MMKLSEIVERYRSLAGGWGKEAALESFGLSREDTETVFGSFDEDYHISRFLHFRNDATGSARTFQINRFPQTHVSIDAEIETIL